MFRFRPPRDVPAPTPHVNLTPGLGAGTKAFLWLTAGFFLACSVTLIVVAVYLWGLSREADATGWWVGFGVYALAALFGEMMLLGAAGSLWKLTFVGYAEAVVALLFLLGMAVVGTAVAAVAGRFVAPAAAGAGVLAAWLFALLAFQRRVQQAADVGARVEASDPPPES